MILTWDQMILSAHYLDLLSHTRQHRFSKLQIAVNESQKIGQPYLRFGKKLSLAEILNGLLRHPFPYDVISYPKESYKKNIWAVYMQLALF